MGVTSALPLKYRWEGVGVIDDFVFLSVLGRAPTATPAHPETWVPDLWDKIPDLPMGAITMPERSGSQCNKEKRNNNGRAKDEYSISHI